MMPKGHFSTLVSPSSTRQKSKKLVSPFKHKKSTLTLKQLKDTISDLFASKLKHDQQCLDSGKQKETMEQHVWTFMRERYGLRQLIVDNMSQIVEAVRAFNGDHDVSLFGKILKSTVDEQFWYVQQ